MISSTQSPTKSEDYISHVKAFIKKHPNYTDLEAIPLTVHQFEGMNAFIKELTQHSVNDVHLSVDQVDNVHPSVDQVDNVHPSVNDKKNIDINIYVYDKKNNDINIYVSNLRTNWDKYCDKIQYHIHDLIKKSNLKGIENYCLNIAVVDSYIRKFELHCTNPTSSRQSIYDMIRNIRYLHHIVGWCSETTDFDTTCYNDMLKLMVWLTRYTTIYNSSEEWSEGEIGTNIGTIIEILGTKTSSIIIGDKLSSLVERIYEVTSDLLKSSLIEHYINMKKKTKFSIIF